MSLINKVLKKIEKKQQSVNTPEDIPYSLSRYSKSGVGGIKGNGRVFYAFLFIISAVMVLFVSYFFSLWISASDGMPSSTVNEEKYSATDVASSQSVLAKKIDQMINEKNYQGALSLMNVRDIAISTDSQAIKKLALVYIALHRDKEAWSLIQTSANRMPGNADIIYLQSYWSYIHGKYQSALDTLLLSNPVLEKHSDYYQLLAQSYLQTSQPDMSARIYKILLDNDPGNSKLWLGLAMSLERSHHSDEARVAYQKVLKLGQLPVATTAYVEQKLSQAQYHAPV